MRLPSIETAGGRRAYALLALWGAAMVFTAFAGVGVYLTRNSPSFAFYLALAAHLQVFAVISGLGALLVKRSYRVSRDGFEIDDRGNEP